MKRCRLFVRIIYLGCALFAGVYAQPMPLFGEISEAELEMTRLAEDPNANAVFLYDIGELTLVNGKDRFFVELKKRVRIKILTEAGKGRAAVNLLYWHQDEIKDIQGYTVLADGKKTLLNDKIIENIKGRYWHRKKFVLPNVRPGAVIEYRYKLISNYFWRLDPWYFQNLEFTKVSQFTAIMPPHFFHETAFRNTLTIQPVKGKKFDPYSQKKQTAYTWRLTDLPPIRKAPFMRRLSDYRKALHFQITAYQDDNFQKSFIDDWPALTEKIATYYAAYLVKDDALKQAVKEQTDNEDNDKAKIKTLYGYVRDNIATVDKKSKYVDKQPQDVLRELAGTGAEKNLLLINLLQLADLQAYPLLISTRYNGRLWIDRKQLEQFDYLLVYVKTTQGQSFILDTRDRYCPFGLLPEDDLVEAGLLIDAQSGEFIPIPKPQPDHTANCQTLASLDDAGALTAALKIRFSGYRAMYARENIRKNGEQEYVKSLFQDRFGNTVTIDSFLIANPGEIDTPLELRINYQIPDFARVVGDVIYLPSPAFNHVHSNIFQKENRYYPVEFGYGVLSVDHLEILLPNGFQPSPIPATIESELASQKLTFKNTWKAVENKLLAKRVYQRGKAVYTADQYNMLRTFTDTIVRADNRQIVLSRSTAGAAEKSSVGFK